MLQGKGEALSWDDLKRQLGKVEKPARYSGGEINSIEKDLTKVDVGFALAFPDTYEVGMSHLGSHILYSVLNSREDIACERVYAPWPDMQMLLEEKNWPLFTLESRYPLGAFDIVGFSLQYELTYTNVVAMLDLGRIPLWAFERDENHPLVIAGGPCALAGEPLAPFMDAFVLGDGEEVILEIVDTYKVWRTSGKPKEKLLQALSEIWGVYVPALYEPEYEEGEHGPLKRMATRDGREAPPVEKRVLKDLHASLRTGSPLIPLTTPIHDRAVVEIFRGCTQGCRFCQAGMIYRPVRERAPSHVCSMARELLERSGYDEVSLVSLSSADYSFIEPVLSSLLQDNPTGAKVSLPSLRVDSFSVGLASLLGSSTKSGLTLAPEAGSQRMRDVINKRVTKEDVLEAVTAAYEAGYSHIKLYFMIGLPGETDDDVRAIGHLASLVRQRGREMGKRPTVVVSVSGFVPKAHTPFQWEPCLSPEELKRRQGILRQTLKGPGLVFKYHDAELTWLEAIFARGDRRLAKALVTAHESGRRFDAWTEHFDKGAWDEVFARSGVDPDFYALRERPEHEVLPWDHLHSGVSKSFLLSERHRAKRAETTEDCRTGSCGDCGVCGKRGTVTSLAKGDSPEVSRTPQSEGEPGEPVKIRVQYAKGDEVRFLSHLDVVRVIHMSLRRAKWPVRMSEGFSPKMRVSFYSPLPVGTAGEEEYFDVLLREPVPLKQLLKSLTEELPKGFSVRGAYQVPLRAPSLDGEIEASEYRVQMKGVDAFSVSRVLSEIDGLDSLPYDVKRRTRTDTVDLKEFLEEIGEVEEMSAGLIVFPVVVRHIDGRTIRPEWFLQAAVRYGLTADPKEAIINRRKILFDRQDERRQDA